MATRAELFQEAKDKATMLEAENTDLKSKLAEAVAWQEAEDKVTVLKTENTELKSKLASPRFRTGAQAKSIDGTLGKTDAPQVKVYIQPGNKSVEIRP